MAILGAGKWLLSATKLAEHFEIIIIIIIITVIIIVTYKAPLIVSQF